MVEIEIKQTGVLGQPDPSAYEDKTLRVGDVQRTPPYSQVPESQKGVKIPDKETKQWLKENFRWYIFLEPKEEGISVFHHLWVVLRNKEGYDEEEDYKRLDNIKQELGQGMLRLEQDGGWALYFSEPYVEKFLIIMKDLISHVPEVQAAFHWLDSQKMVYRKGSIELGKFEQEYKILF